jgi:formate dehydrogenase major subunit
VKLSRRSFLKLSGATVTAAALTGLGFKVRSASAAPLRIAEAKETTTICPYCGVGCGIVCHSINGKVVNCEGDPDHPINLGSLCSKGSALYQLAVNERRLTKVKYRAAGSDHWEEKTWDWAIAEIAKRIKKTRDESFETVDQAGVTVNRTNALACMGGAALDNEECYAYSKFVRGLGVAWLDHQARI